MDRRYDNIIVTGKSGAGKQPRIDVLTKTFDLKQLSTGNIFRTYLGLFNELGYNGGLDRFYDTHEDHFIDDAAIKEILGVADHERADCIVLGMKAEYYINQGKFVPDAITNALFEFAFASMEHRGAVLDGYPRTLAQARFLCQTADEHGVRLDAILLVENDDASIIKRIVGRRICKNCGEVYHVEYKPPPQSGCGGDENKRCDVVQRSDDTIENIQKRLEEFYTKTRPVIDYLVEQGIPLYTVPGNLPEYSPENVKASVFEAMGIE